MKGNYTYDPKTGRWRKNGKFASPPKLSQLAKDSIGRPRDAHGRMVPAKAIAKPSPKKRKKAAPKPAPKSQKKRPLPKPAPKRKTKPKRKPTPKRKPAKKDKRGKVARAHETLRKPKRGPRPVKPPALPKPVRKPAPRVRYVADGERITPRPLLSSRYNLAEPSQIGDILYNTIQNKAAYSQVGPDDVLLYQFGIQFINNRGAGSLEETTRLVEKLAREYPQFSFRYSDDSVHVFLGDPEKPILRADARTIINRKRDELIDIFYYLNDLWDGDVAWFLVAENDELEGGS